MDDISPFEPTVLGAMRKYWWLVALIVVAITALAVVYAYFSPVSYEATASLVVEDPAASALFDVGIVQSPQRYVADQAAILSSAVVADRAADAEPSPDDVDVVLVGLDVFWGQDSNLIQVVFIGVGHRQKVGPVEDLADRLAFLETEVLGYVYNNAPLRDNMTRSEGSLKDVLGETLRSNPRG